MNCLHFTGEGNLRAKKLIWFLGVLENLQLLGNSKRVEKNFKINWIMVIEMKTFMRSYPVWERFLDEKFIF